MGNCLFGCPSDHDSIIKVINSAGGIMEFYAPVTAESITDEFPGHAIFRGHDLFWKPVPHHEFLVTGNSKKHQIALIGCKNRLTRIKQMLKALQPPSTLPVTIPRFGENMKADLEQKLIDDLDEPLIVLESYGMINKNELADGDVAPVDVVAPIAAIAPVVAPLEESFVLLE
nr:hypothetical protein [Tanacetum cinerariifolium]